MKLKPLTTFTMRVQPFVWESEQQLAFEIVVNDYLTAPTLQHCNSDRVVIIETVAWNTVSIGVLSQYDDDGVLHPVACFSMKHTPSRCKYNICDKELMAMVNVIEKWRHECDGVTNTF
jgi:hypothetical protein